MPSSASIRAVSRWRRTCRAGCPGLAIVGLADRACQEAKERVRSGIASAELEWPSKRITVNLAPAGLRKEGSGFDLPIALAILAARGSSRPTRSPGTRRSASWHSTGVCGRCTACSRSRRARALGLERLLCPAESAPEAALAGGEPVPVRHLAEAVGVPERGTRARFEPPGGTGPEPPGAGPGRGPRAGAGAARARNRRGGPSQPAARRARPAPGRRCWRGGCRRSCRRWSAEALEVTRIHSVAGLVTRPAAGDAPPFRAPHHTASTAAIVGGGPGPRPGEASLAHHGVLLLDELAEFRGRRSRRCGSRSRTARQRRARRRRATYSGPFPARRQR